MAVKLCSRLWAQPAIAAQIPLRILSVQHFPSIISHHCTLMCAPNTHPNEQYFHRSGYSCPPVVKQGAGSADSAFELPVAVHIHSWSQHLGATKKDASHMHLIRGGLNGNHQGMLTLKGHQWQHTISAQYGGELPTQGRSL